MLISVVSDKRKTVLYYTCCTVQQFSCVFAIIPPSDNLLSYILSFSVTLDHIIFLVIYLIMAVRIGSLFFEERINYFLRYLWVLPVAVYDGCGFVAFVYWLRLNQYLYFPWRVSPIYGSDSLGAVCGMGMLSSFICRTLVSVCAMKCIIIGILAQWVKELTYISLISFV